MDVEGRGKSSEGGTVAGARVLRDDGNVVELYDDDKLDDGGIESDRSSGGDFAACVDRPGGDDRRILRRRLSQSLSIP